MTDAALTLMQWLSPAFPVGSFAYSHGLEQVIADGTVSDADTLHGWLEAIVGSGSGRADAILLAAAYNATDPAPVDQTARAFAASAERLRETTLQGAAFCQTAHAVWGLQITGLTYPVAVGTAARLMQVPLDQTLKLYLHAFASNLVSAAQRALPLGQTEGQRLLARLAPCLISTAEAAMILQLDDLSSTTFAADIASMRHETLEPRIFRS
jgi:urease accessory protein